jgi:hypothetical protein
MLIFLNVIFACVLIGPIAQSALKYDKARRDEMQSVINSWIRSSKGKTLEIPFAQAESQLSLAGVRWSKAYTNVPDGEMRIYHFRGFYLVLSLRKLMPDKPPTWTSEDLKKRGQWYVYHFYPALGVDGLDDPEKRMSNYWAALAESFRRRNEEAKQARRARSSKAIRRRARSNRRTLRLIGGSSFKVFLRAENA